jgi:hypothetical protein
LAEEFWSSEEGVLIRLEDLSHDFAFRTYNGALLGAFRESGFKTLKWVGVMDAHICEECEDLNGEEYQTNWFLPRMPRHVKCRCFWDVLMAL